MASPSHPLPQAQEVEEPCVMCNNSPARRCGRCLSVFYCSRGCQKTDFPSHKLLCRQYAEQHSRPTPDHKRAIFFPPDEDKPRMIWMKTERCDDEGYPLTIADYSLLGGACPERIQILENKVRGRFLGRGFDETEEEKYGYSIELAVRNSYIADGSILNRSFLASMRPSGPPGLYHRGPILATRVVPIEAYEDITLADFRHIIDHSLLYGIVPTRTFGTIPLPPPFALAPPPAPAPAQEATAEPLSQDL